jgi:hypothetical protein
VLLTWPLQVESQVVVVVVKAQLMLRLQQVVVHKMLAQME